MTSANGNFAIHHLGVAVSEMERALAFYRSVLGFSLVSEVITDPIQKVEVCFLRNAPDPNLTIELVHPTEAASPVNGYLSKGVGAYHICYEVGRLEDALADLRAKGCVPIAAPVPAAAFEGRRIAWCMTPTKHLVELLEGRPSH